VKLNATPETIRAVAEVFKLAALFDDRIAHADKHRIAAWAEQVQRHHLLEADLLDGLQAFYDGPSPHPIGVGDLVHHARQACRARAQHDQPQRDENPPGDTKAARDVHQLTAGAFTGPVKHKTRRLTQAEIGLQVCEGKRASIAAIREYFAAKAEANR